MERGGGIGRYLRVVGLKTLGRKEPRIRIVSTAVLVAVREAFVRDKMTRVFRVFTYIA